MRRARTRLLALGIGTVALASAVFFAGIRNREPSRAAATAPDGAAVYARLRCATCHSIAGRGNSRLPLDGVGRRLRPDEIRRWVVAPGEMNPDVRKPRYDHTPAADLEALVAYLAALP